MPSFSPRLEVVIIVVVLASHHHLSVHQIRVEADPMRSFSASQLLQVVLLSALFSPVLRCVLPVLLLLTFHVLGLTKDKQIGKV